MAIYHCVKKTFSRKTSNLASILAYRTGQSLRSEIDNEIKYPHRNMSDIQNVQIFNNPFKDIQEFVKESENKFKRKDERITTEWELALPRELDLKNRNAIVKEFAEDYTKRYNVTVIASSHKDSDNNGNFHCHMIASDRQIINNQLGNKNRAVKSVVELEKTKKIWEEIVNKHLAKNGINQKISRKNKFEKSADKMQIENNITNAKLKDLKLQQKLIQKLIEQKKQENKTSTKIKNIFKKKKKIFPIIEKKIIKAPKINTPIISRGKIKIKKIEIKLKWNQEDSNSETQELTQNQARENEKTFRKVRQVRRQIQETQAFNRKIGTRRKARNRRIRKIRDKIKYIEKINISKETKKYNNLFSKKFDNYKEKLRNPNKIKQADETQLKEIQPQKVIRKETLEKEKIKPDKTKKIVPEETIIKPKRSIKL